MRDEHNEYVAALEQYREAAERLRVAKNALQKAYLKAVGKGHSLDELEVQLGGVRKVVLREFERQARYYYGDRRLREHSANAG